MGNLLIIETIAAPAKVTYRYCCISARHIELWFLMQIRTKLAIVSKSSVMIGIRVFLRA